MPLAANYAQNNGDVICGSSVNTYGHMQLELLVMKIILRKIVYLLFFQEKSLLFFANSYHCKSGAVDSYNNTYYSLWDGAGCSINNTCCSNTSQSWFNHQLNETTQDNIEVRICRNSTFPMRNIALDILELYIHYCIVRILYFVKSFVIH